MASLKRCPDVVLHSHVAKRAQTHGPSSSFKEAKFHLTRHPYLDADRLGLSFVFLEIVRFACEHQVVVADPEHFCRKFEKV